MDMSAMKGSSPGAGGRADTAWQRAVRADERAAQETANAERHEQLFAETGRVLHSTMAARYRAVAERHRTTARLQQAYAHRLAEAESRGGGFRPLFMAGVAEACGTRSAALTLIGVDLSQLAVAASDRPSRGAQDLEYVLTAGPGIDAVRARRTVYASGPVLEKRWPGYGSGIAALGLSSVAALPLKVASDCIGVLTVFDPPSALARSGKFREVAAALVDCVLIGPDADPGLYGGADLRATVHQAAGVLSEQVGSSVHDALALIKARAFALSIPLDSVARSVISGELKL